MEQQHQLGINSFIYPIRRYHGQVKPEALVFNANLQEFAQRASYISNLQTRGKLSPQEAYNQIKALWEQLKTSYSSLGMAKDTENEAGIAD